MNDSDYPIHAVRWASRRIKRMGMFDYGKWHMAINAYDTICGLKIKIACDNDGTFFPEIKRLTAVDCKHCLRKMSRDTK